MAETRLIVKTGSITCFSFTPSVAPALKMRLKTGPVIRELNSKY